jgi:hypothetical protein
MIEVTPARTIFVRKLAAWRYVKAPLVVVSRATMRPVGRDLHESA